MAFSEAAPYRLCPFTGGRYTQAKARKGSDAPPQWHILYASSSRLTSKLKPTSSSAEWCVVLVILQFVSLMIG